MRERGGKAAQKGQLVRLGRRSRWARAAGSGKDSGRERVVCGELACATRVETRQADAVVSSRTHSAAACDACHTTSSRVTLRGRTLLRSVVVVVRGLRHPDQPRVRGRSTCHTSSSVSSSFRRRVSCSSNPLSRAALLRYNRAGGVRAADWTHHLLVMWVSRERMSIRLGESPLVEGSIQPQGRWQAAYGTPSCLSGGAPGSSCASSARCICGTSGASPTVSHSAASKTESTCNGGGGGTPL